jgi:hypothetical protein
MYGTIAVGMGASPLSWRFPDRAGAAALVLLVVWLFRGAIFGGGVFYARDIHLMWVPQVEGFVRSVAAGSLPLWDPSPSFGQRLLADPGAQVLYPPDWLNLVLRPWTDYSLFAFGHVLLAALGMWALARRWGLSRRSALLAGAMWILAGPFWSLTDLWHHFASAAWMPLVLLTADRACESRRARDAGLAGLVFGMQVLAGSADMCAMTAALAAFVLAWRHRPASGGLAGWRELGRTGLIVGAVAALLSAGVWMPAFDGLRRSTRAELPASIRSYWSVHPASLVELVVPEPFEGVPLRTDVRAALYEGREPFLTSLYLGLPGLALLAAGLGSSRTDDGRRWQGPLGITFVAALVLALGRHTPLFALAGALFPPIRILRYPAKIMVLVAFAFALLAGEGLDAWSENRPRRRLASTLLTAALAALAAGVAVTALLVHARPDLVAGLLAGSPPGVEPARLLAWLRPRVDVAAAWGALSTVALLVSSSRRGAWVGPLVALVAVADLAAWHRQPSPLAPRALYTYRPKVVDAIGDPSTTRVFVHDYTVADKAARLLGRPRAHVLARIPEGWSADAALALAMQQTLTGQTPGRWGLRQGYDIDYRGLQSRATAYLGALLRKAERDDPATFLRLLQIGGVTHVVALHEDHSGLRLVGRFESLLPEDTLLYAVPDPLPRCLLVSGVRVARDVAALETLADPGFDPHREVVLPEGTARPPDPRFHARIGRCEAGPDRMRVEVDTDREAWLVLTESFAPGWRARVDGRAAPVLPANVAFRAVAVPAGRHEVRLRYAPTAALVGLTLSGLTSLLALGLAARAFTVRSPRP